MLSPLNLLAKTNEPGRLSPATVPLDRNHPSDYMLSDLDYDTTPAFSMVSGKPKPTYTAVSAKEDSDSETESEEKDETPDVLDVIAVKQFHQSKMDGASQFYIGSLTVVGLYILYRYLRK
jgi:hypothetical protein